MLNNLLDELYVHNIEIILHDNKKLKLLYDKNHNIETLKQKIKQNKYKIIARLQENQDAYSKGFNIYGHGDLYEYRYGYGSYLYIERYENELVSVYRLNYFKGGVKPYKVKIVRENCSFERGLKDATGFIQWLNKRQKIG
ncbi:hypothetical protein MUN88_14170 [Gracilibacillus caseinilyticus]|uniref:TubC N-terminal docking domain-containing protein n=1 Tax=Gracilibacillus caseinilyticus TaxID=2932256 RepID=A0ABY4ES07_9BACI|nr:hypothetical protein [Gracilibacillus caseinilyticus]UOQ47213.1 hypothetical protein MUN88_14170 [Gracilibacillus caseinilyticus]